MKKGFTLIELLVVVLIIGILSAVALPQYQRTVEKARAAEAMTILRSIADANRRYYLANGEYTHDLDNLDIQIPGTDSNYNDMKRKASRYFMYGSRGTSSNSLEGIIAAANRLPIQTNYSLVIYADQDGVFCYTYSTEGVKNCKTLGATDATDIGQFYLVK